MPPAGATEPLVLRFDAITAADLPRVGGKNASLGEMTRELGAAGIAVPPGFATTATAYRAFVEANALAPVITREIAALHAGVRPLRAVGAALRAAFSRGRLPDVVRRAVLEAYAALGRAVGTEAPAVAVRSSATAEDLPTASFAGQQETYLNIVGEAPLLEAVVQCITSLFTDRAIAYREANGFDHAAIALSVGVQLMVRADVGAAGVMFTLETETGYPHAVLLNAAFGLGESVVKGITDPDEILLFKPALARPGCRPLLRTRLGDKARMVVLGDAREPTRTVDTPPVLRARFALTDDDAITLGRWAVRIEDHFTRRAGHPVPMDIEWARDGITGRLYILQARPETIHARVEAAPRVVRTLADTSRVLARGRSVGEGIAAGRVQVLRTPAEPFEAGSVLVTEMTDPDWLPLMRRAAAIVTDHGGRTCHAAILSRELGIPAVVGTGAATRALRDAGAVTVSCAQGEEGLVYEGRLEWVERPVVDAPPVRTRTRVLMNLADPGAALRLWRRPVDGIGLARTEFIFADAVRVHPMALLHPERIADPATRAQVQALRAGERTPGAYVVDALARGVALLAASQWPKPVIVRLSDFKSNEYARLLGGADLEPREENPMLGFRGAMRYTHEHYREAFALECQAMRKVRDEIGLDNIRLMIPFCRTIGEADAVLAALAAAGLERGREGLEVLVMCEVPSNVICAEAFARRFDGFSIGSNDLTQLVLGVDRDSVLLAGTFDERDPAVQAMIRDVITRAHAVGVPVGLCGQAPSDDPTFAELLVDVGIDSISVDPGTVERVRARVAAAEARRAAAPPRSARAELRAEGLHPSDERVEVPVG
jgi:pyruvate, water dikinase